MKRILIIDPCCPKPYDPHTLATEGLGGTEATVIRVAEALGEDVNVFVTQHNRRFLDLQSKASYGPYNDLLLLQKWHAIILLRDPRGLAEIRAKQPTTPLFLWMHDIAGNWVLQHHEVIAKTKATIVAVSDWHKLQIQELLKVAFRDFTKVPRVVRVYNPIDDSLKRDDTVYDPNKLVFFSAPHKGLKYALEMFERALEFNPDFKFYIANPGYFFDQSVQIAGKCMNLGALPHTQVLQHVRESLCVFYPNYVFPETFGLVMAEANAVGTPVLTHPIGAALEVLSSRVQVLDCLNRVSLIDRLMAWHSGNRPVVSGKPEFRTTAVVREWAKLLKI